MPIIHGPNGPEFRSAETQDTETQGAPELTPGMRLVNEDRPRSEAPAVPADVAGEGTPRLTPGMNPTNLNPLHGGAPAVPTDAAGDERAKYNGTPAWWVSRGYEPPIAHLLVHHDVQPKDVRGRAPKSLSSLMSSEMSLPYGKASAQIRSEAVVLLMQKVNPRAPDKLVGGAPCVSTRTGATVSAPKRSAVQAVSAPKRSAVQADLQTPAEGLVLAANLEQDEKRRQAALLAEELGPARVAVACGFPRPEVWERLPASGPRSGQELWLKHATAFSAGLLQGVRRAIVRLREWLEQNDLDDVCSIDQCEGGVLAWFVLDEQAKSRTEGLSVPNSLRNHLVSAHNNFGLKGLLAHDTAFKNMSLPPSRTPKPATAATTEMIYRYSSLAANHPSEAVRVYAGGFVLCQLAALRVRDAQRAALQFPQRGTTAVSGMCYTSKHPKRRTAKEMPIYVPRTSNTLGDWTAALKSRVAGGLQPDYVFPRLKVPRGCTIEHERVCFLDGPAKSADIIKAMRWILRIDNFMTEAESKTFSGHSARHWAVTVARLLALPIEDRNELGRWIAALVDAQARRANMPNAYSAVDAEAPRVLAVLSKIVAETHERVEAAGGATKLPRHKPWSLYSDDMLVLDLEGEASTSGSESD